MNKSQALAALLGSLVAAAGAAAGMGDDLQVRLRYASFDPLVGEPAIPEGLHGGSDSGAYLVQFHGAPTPWMRQQIQARGGRVERFLTDHTHVVRLANADQVLRDLPFVRWVGLYHPAYRLEPEIISELVGGFDRGAARYSVEAFSPRDAAAVARRVHQAGGLLETVTPQGRLEATLTLAQVAQIAAMDEVNYIDRAGPAGADMQILRQLVGAAPGLSGAGFLGQGVRGEVIDFGMDVEHPDVQSPPPLLRCSTAPPAADVHGTAMYGIIFGTGAGNAAATGLLPQAEQGIFCSAGVPSSPQQHYGELVDPAGPFRAVFQCRAIGSAHTTAYSTISAEMDQALFLHDILVAQSQGSEGAPGSRPQAWAKNIVSVGGVLHQDTLIRADDSGGLATQAADGRVKPDLAAVRDHVFTIAPSGYGTFAGTSAATGVVAGCFGLVFQMWHEGVWDGFGGSATVFDSKPKATTAKALLINAAFQYDWTAGGPNATITRRVQGWGMPDLDALHAARDKTFIVNETDPLAPLQVRTYALHVGPNEPALRATMVYLDPPGTPAAAVARVNDLSLKVTAPDSTIYWGNSGMLSSPWTSSGGTADTLNTVENVFVQNPMPGEWTIEVIGSEIVQDARLESPELDADFALVVSGIIPGQACYANCDGSTLPPVLNVADFGCFLTRFAAGDPYANCDGSTQQPVLNVADFGCFLQAFAAGCP